ncbi:MAG: tetratricopeptide repeat-containing sulfotransferase family protein [Steroidobacteraceae bacterium]
MIRHWFDSREAAEIGIALADQYAQQLDSAVAPVGGKTEEGESRDPLQGILNRAGHELRTLRLNFYKRAKFANSFKWRLLEKGVGRDIADRVTEKLVLHLSLNQAGWTLGQNEIAGPSDEPQSRNERSLLSQGNKCAAHGENSEAITFYRELLALNPRHPEALRNLGAILFRLGRYSEAEECFRRTVRMYPDFADANSNLGILLGTRGRFGEAETWLRRAIKINPKHVEARTNLGLGFVFFGRLSDAKAQFRKAFKFAPRHAHTLFAMGFLATIEGGFDEAEAMFKRAIEVDPKMPRAWAAMAGLRKMTTSDAAWAQSAKEIAASGVTVLEEADLRFAIGKYCDDVEDFKGAFQSYERANKLQKMAATSYDRDGRARLVDDLMRVYTREAISHVGPPASDSMKPIFVVGMPRSGTSLMEQIIASHPDAKGAGELTFWGRAARDHETAIRRTLLEESTRKKLAEDYLRDLQARCGDALRIVDKTPVNSDYLGVIHSIFPNARIIYMQRDPIDACLSCYFQKFGVELNFTMDLSDLAHYFRQHQRLMAHWRAVLPPGSVLEVPYAELVTDQEGWTRKVLAFLGLEWDPRCLDFHRTERSVVTASAWQVRQKIYRTSVARWRSYEEFIGPLLELKGPAR